MSWSSPIEPNLACPVPARNGPAASRAKRVLDVLIALAALAFLAPLLCLVAGLIALDSPGGVLFRQWRTGLGGRPFRIYKFRSMRCAEDGQQVRQAQRSDSRVTRVGAFIRRTSIDELPQLFNILKGEMSIVGPRPHAVAHDIEFQASAPNYSKRFQARPGLTGMAQASGCRGEIFSQDDLLQRSQLDNAYVSKWSLALDIRIILQTAVVVLFQRSAY